MISMGGLSNDEDGVNADMGDSLSNMEVAEEWRMQIMRKDQATQECGYCVWQQGDAEPVV